MSDRVHCQRVRPGYGFPHGNPYVVPPLVTSPPPQRCGGSVKVRYGSEIIRVGVDHMSVPWPAFCSNLRDLTRDALQGVERGSAWKVTYTDDEGDTILIRSDPELHESFRAQRGPIKRYTVERGTAVVEEATPTGPTVPRSELFRTPFAVPPPSPTTVEVTVQQLQQPDDAPVEVLFHAPSVRLLSLLHTHQHALAVRFFERHRTSTDNTFLYNGACAYALCGNVQQACATLERAVLNGYRDLQHLVSDSDLDSIRSAPEYVNVVQLITALVDSHDTPAVSSPTAPTAECTRVPPVQFPQSYPTDRPVSSPVTVEPVVVVAAPQQQQQQQVVQVVEETKPVVEEFAYQSVLTTCIDMGLTDTPALRALIVKEDGDVAKVLDKLLATPR